MIFAFVLGLTFTLGSILIFISAPILIVFLENLIKNNVQKMIKIDINFFLQVQV